jgi:hypothetical protein
VKRAREECSTPIFNSSTTSRSKPAVVVKILSVKDARCFAHACCLRCLLHVR